MTTGVLSTRDLPRCDNFIVLGEAPGRLEDYKGKPFIGPAGQLLRKTLRKVGINPDAAVYMNAVSCWPHGTPEDRHIIQCHDNLKAQLDAVPCEHVLACGRVALQALLPHAKLTPALGLFIKVHGKIIYPVYHPSYLNRNKDKTIRAEWERDLYNFGDALAYTELELIDNEYCVYCRKRTLTQDIPACTTKAHRDWWKSDSTKWKRPVPPQLTLGL